MSTDSSQGLPYRGGQRFAAPARKRDATPGHADIRYPLITIVTVVFNGAATLEATITSVVGQTYPRVEYLVVDGGSTDGTIELLRRYDASIDMWISEPDGGIYDAWNKAVALATGEWLLFLGADDRIASPDALCRMVDAVGVDQFAKERIVYGNIEVVDPLTDKTAEVIRMPWTEMRQRFEFFKPKLPRFPEALINRKLTSGAETFDTTYRIAGDARFLLQALQAGIVPRYADVLLTRMSHGGISSNPKQLWRTASEVRRAVRETDTRTPLTHRTREWIKLVAKFVVLRALPRTLSNALANVFRRATGRGPLSLP